MRIRARVPIAGHNECADTPAGQRADIAHGEHGRVVLGHGRRGLANEELDVLGGKCLLGRQASEIVIGDQGKPSQEFAGVEAGVELVDGRGDRFPDLSVDRLTDRNRDNRRFNLRQIYEVFRRRANQRQSPRS